MYLYCVVRVHARYVNIYFIYKVGHFKSSSQAENVWTPDIVYPIIYIYWGKKKKIKVWLEIYSQI